MQRAHHFEVTGSRATIWIQKISGKECQRRVKVKPIGGAADGSHAEIDGEDLIAMVETKDDERSDGIERGQNEDQAEERQLSVTNG